jgi:hypothetical protein
MKLVSSIFILFSFLLQGCRNHILEPHPLSACSQSFQKEKGLVLVNSSNLSMASNRKLMLHFRSDKQLNISEARHMIVQITSEIFHTRKANENFSLRNLEIWVSFLDKKCKHPSKEYIGFATLSEGNLCYRHYDKDRFPYDEFYNYHNETLEKAILLAKDSFSSSKPDHLMVSELEIIAKHEQLPPIICIPL